MKFLLDENTLPRLIETLETVYEFTEHEFHHVTTLGWAGEQDEPLFEQAAANRFDVIVTGDRRHLVDHLSPLRHSGLHWVGYKRAKLSGLALLGYETSLLVGAMDHIIDELELAKDQRLLALKGAGRERNQRLEVLTGDRIRRFGRG